VALRLTLPTATGLYNNAHPFAFDLGVAAEYAATEWLDVFGGFMALASFVTSSADALPRGGLALDLGFNLEPVWWFAFALSVTSQALYVDTIDHIAIAGAFRFSFDDHLGLELGATMPLAGVERATAVANLALSYRFD